MRCPLLITCCLLLLSPACGSQDASAPSPAAPAAEPAYHQYIGYLEPTAPRYLNLIFDCSELEAPASQLPALWEHPARGTLPLGWALPPSILEAAPAALQRCYADAYRFGLDQFVLGPGAAEQPLAAAKTLDLHCFLYAGPASPDLVARFAAEARAQGVFVLDSPSFEPLLVEGIPVLHAPRIESIEAGVTYLNRIPLNRRFAALCLDPHKLTPGDAAHLAAHVADRFLLVPPEELIQLMRLSVPPTQPGPRLCGSRST